MTYANCFAGAGDEDDAAIVTDNFEGKLLIQFDARLPKINFNTESSDSTVL